MCVLAQLLPGDMLLAGSKDDVLIHHIVCMPLLQVTTHLLPLPSAACWGLLATVSQDSLCAGQFSS